jgi:hypothetical protein
MNPRKFTFRQPPKIPVPQGNAFAVADILIGDRGEPVIVSRDPKSCPAVVRKSTGELAHLVRSITGTIPDFPMPGQTTLVTEEIIVMFPSHGEPEVFIKWDQADWKVVQHQA